MLRKLELPAVPACLWCQQSSTELVLITLECVAVSTQARSLQESSPGIDLSKIDLSKLPALPALGLMPTGE